MVPLLEIRDLSCSFDGVKAVDHFDLYVSAGETVGLIGPNGAGKTTLFNLLTGILRPDGGEVRFEGNPITHLPADAYAFLGIARTFQNGRLCGNLSVLENILIGAHARRRAAQEHSFLQGMLLELAGSIAPLLPFAKEDQGLVHAAEEVMALFGDRLSAHRNQPAAVLSFANRRRLELARALVLRPRLLLLDEPTAGMNPVETAEMQDFLLGLKRPDLSILLVEHKLPLVMQLSDRVVLMNGGRKIVEGRPEEIRQDRRLVEVYLGSKRSHGEVSDISQKEPSRAPDSREPA